MKIIALLGSPHGLRGNTARLLRHVLEITEGEGALTETVVLKGDSVLPCLGCDACHKKGSCVQKDDFESIKDKVKSADGLVLASPNYIFNVSAQLKAFMDRCCGVIHCMQFWGKYGASVVTSGGGGDDSILEYMNHFLVTTGAVPVGSVSANMSAMPGETLSTEVLENARTLGKQLVNAWRSGEVPTDVNGRRDAFRRRMQSLIEYRKEVWHYEYRYWQNKKD